MQTSFLSGKPLPGALVTPRSRNARFVAVAANRPTWLPGVEPPKHLDGSLAGDYGFDPLNLAAEPRALKWYTQSETFHSRLAMASNAGILIPGILKAAGILDLPEWYNAGLEAQKGSFAPFSTLLAVEIILFGFVECKRWADFIKPGSQGEPGSFLGFESSLKGKENAYPGGLFDPLNFSSGPSYEEYKVKEIKNGRLAMLACLGYAAQAGATGKGPIENLVEHLKNPFANNFTTNGVSLPFL